MFQIKNITKKLVPNSIRTQLILGIAIVHLILMAVFVFDLVRRQENFLKDQNLTQAINLANSFGINSSNYILTNDFYFLERITRSYKKFPYLKYAMILSTENEVLAHTDKKYVGNFLSDSISKSIKPELKPQVLVNDSYLLDVAVPVQNNGTIIGWARLGISQDYIRQNLQSIINGGIFYILIALILGSIFAVIFANIFSQGLYKLIEAAQEIKSGNRNKRINDLQSVELNKLGEALNKMLDDIVSNEALLNLVLKNMPVGVWILGPDGQILSANPATKEIWKDIKYVGLEEYGVYKAHFTDTGKQVEAHEWGGAIAIREQREVMNQEVEIECFDGSSKYIINSAIPMKDNNNKHIGALVINVDITQRKNLENERERMVSNLLMRNRDLEQFSYIVSHNIRGPLSTLLSICDLFKYDVTEEDKEMAVSGIRQETQKLDSVIADLNFILNAKNGIMQNKEAVNFDGVMAKVMEELKVEISQSRAKIHFNFDKANELITVKSIIDNVFVNLISNSIKFRKSDIEPQINIWSEKESGQVKIYFEDNGMGIDMKRYRNQVFGLYKRFNFNTKGKGMGLFMIKNQINALHGNIELESYPGKGTTFIVTLPIEETIE